MKKFKDLKPGDVIYKINNVNIRSKFSVTKYTVEESFTENDFTQNLKISTEGEYPAGYSLWNRIFVHPDKTNDENYFINKEDIINEAILKSEKIENEIRLLNELKRKVDDFIESEDEDKLMNINYICL